jgi:hypothetical protein
VCFPASFFILPALHRIALRRTTLHCTKRHVSASRHPLCARLPADASVPRRAVTSRISIDNVRARWSGVLSLASFTALLSLLSLHRPASAFFSSSASHLSFRPPHPLLPVRSYCSPISFLFVQLSPDCRFGEALRLRARDARLEHVAIEFLLSA